MEALVFPPIVPSLLIRPYLDLTPVISSYRDVSRIVSIMSIIPYAVTMVVRLDVSLVVVDNGKKISEDILERERSRNVRLFIMEADGNTVVEEDVEIIPVVSILAETGVVDAGCFEITGIVVSVVSISSEDAFPTFGVRRRLTVLYNAIEHDRRDL